MKPALQLRMSQQLTLTPQLKLAIRLLQLSSLELEAEIRQALENNPVLEIDGDPAFGEAPAEPHPEPGEVGSDEAADVEAADDDWSLDLPSGAPAAAADEEDYEPQQAATEDLASHLLWQLNLCRLNPRDQLIARALVDALDAEGYLDESLQSLQETLSADLSDLRLAEIEAVLHRVQQLDPLGVAARSLGECLAIQLRALDSGSPGRDLALRLTGQLELLARNDRTRLKKRLGCEDAELDQAIALLRSLDPKPGARIGVSLPEYVKPDVYVDRHGGRWRVRLNPDCQPRLAISRHYAALVSAASREDASYLRGHLQEARWLIRSLQTRNQTMLKVARCIVDRQQDFLERGPEAMRPLVLRDVAEAIGMHESTISRVTTRKYMHTPRGVFEFKHFFSSHVGTRDGGEASATAIQAMIRKLIAAEPPSKPLSDNALAKRLNAEGITVARRTVAKYREAMNIPASHERVRLA